MSTTNHAISALGAGDYLEFEKPLLRIQHDIEELQREQRGNSRDHSRDIKQQRSRFNATLKKIYKSLTPWETVLVARHPKRPLSPDYVNMCFRDFVELHGDRLYADDKAIITGLGRIGSHKVLFVGHNKGKDVKERVACNFGCAHPEGYRKALAKMKMAEKFGLPIVCLIDTQGAYPGIGSEERGISTAIAVNLLEMSRLRAPVVCAVIGEGGSGGALGIGVGDRVAMFENSFYSVISPEGCAAILWKTAEQRKHAAEALNLTAKSLKKLDIIDEVIPEPVGGAHRFPQKAGEHLEKFIVTALDSLAKKDIDDTLDARYDRIRSLGSFFSDPDRRRILSTASQRKRSRRTKPRASRLRQRMVDPEQVSA